MNNSTAHPFRIVVAIDDSEMAREVLERAIDVAGRHERPELHIIRVVDISPGFLRRGGHEGMVDAAHDGAATLVRETLDDFGRNEAKWRVHVHARGGSPAEEIVSLAADVEADLILVGRHAGIGVRSKHVGSVPSRVLREAQCPVLVTQPMGYEVHEAAEQCPKCVQARAESDGAIWFCPEHASERTFRTSSLLAGVYSASDGQLA